MSRTPCPDREPLLEALLFDELTSIDRSELENHVERCDGCREALDDARIAMAALVHVSDPSLPYDEIDRSARAWSDFRKRLPSSAPPPLRRRAPATRMSIISASRASRFVERML